MNTRVKNIVFTCIAICFAQVMSAQLSNRIITKDYNECLTGVKDTLGNWVIEPKYSDIEKCGQEQFQVTNGPFVGILDSMGKVQLPLMYAEIIPSRYDGAGEANFFQVNLNGQWGVVDKNNRIIVPVAYKEISFNYDTTFFARTNRRSWLLYKKDGSHVAARWKTRHTPHAMKSGFYSFHHNRWFLSDRFGAMDANGNEVLPMHYSGIQGNSGSSLITVQRRGKIGFCDSTGHFVWPIQFDGHSGYLWNDDFYDGWLYYGDGFADDSITSVKRNHRAGLISESGRLLLPFVYDEIDEYENQSCSSRRQYSVQTDTSYGIFDVTRGWVIGPYPTGTTFLQSYCRSGDSMAVALLVDSVNGKWGAHLTSGQEILKHTFDDVQYDAGLITFLSRDSIVKIDFTTQLDLRIAILLNDSAHSGFGSYYVGVVNSIPANGKFAVYRPQRGTTVFYNPLCIRDTAWTSTGRPIPIGKTRLGLPDSIFLASAFIVKTDTDVVTLLNGERKLGFYVQYRDSSGKYATDEIVDVHYDKVHTYYSTKRGMLFRDDGKIILARYAYVQIVTVERTPGRLEFLVIDHHGNEAVLDTSGKYIVPLQHGQIGEYNSHYAWISTTEKSGVAMYSPQGGWKLIDSTGKTVYNQSSKLLYHPALFGKMLITYSRKNGDRLYDVEQSRFTSQGYSDIHSMNADGTLFMARTCSGHNGVLNATGQFVVDTSWNYFTPVNKTGDYENIRRDYESYTNESFYQWYVFYNDSESILFNTDSGTIYNGDRLPALFAGSFIDEEDSLPSYIYITQGDFSAIVLSSDARLMMPWHKQCLIDSLLIHKRPTSRVDDEPGASDYVYNCYWCTDHHFPGMFYMPNGASSYGQVLITDELSDSLLVFHRCNYLNRRSSFTNLLLFPDGAHTLLLDSIFNPAIDWRNFVINAMMSYINSHLYIKGDCGNPASFPLMLRNRFLLSADGIVLYPKDFTENGKELAITIPWKDADPYLRYDIKSKLHVHSQAK